MYKVYFKTPFGTQIKDCASLNEIKQANKTFRVEFANQYNKNGKFLRTITLPAPQVQQVTPGQTALFN